MRSKGLHLAESKIGLRKQVSCARTAALAGLCGQMSSLGSIEHDGSDCEVINDI